MSRSRKSPQIRALEKARFAIKTPLPQEYDAVLSSLSDEELAVLIDVKHRLDAAEKETPPEVGPYREYFHPF